MPKSPLEVELTAITEEFVARIVAALRNASFGDVAALAPAPAQVRRAPARAAERSNGGRTNNTELAERIADTLRKSGSPLNARAIASELGVAADKLAVPLKSLRDAGRVKKHGDKRATTYSAT